MPPHTKLVTRRRTTRSMIKSGDVVQEEEFSESVTVDKPLKIKRKSAPCAAAKSMIKRKSGAKAIDLAEAASNLVREQEETECQVFQKFKTTAKLMDGPCMIRNLGNGNFELVNFNSIEAEVLGSMEVGSLIRGDKTGGRLKAIEEVEKKLKSVEFKVGVALNSAKLNIFRFLKLPIELRFRIYDLAISSDKGLAHGSYKYGPDRILPGIQLSATCRQVYEETRRFFWRNNFFISDVSKNTKPLVPLLTDNLREVTFSWWAFQIKDLQVLRMFENCKNLKILHVRLTKFSLTKHDEHSKKQYLHQNEPAVAKFKRTNGFDALISLRGLELVTVKNDYDASLKVDSGDLSDEELKTFESFLNKQLTRPKPVMKVEKNAKSSKKTSKTRHKKRSLDDDDGWEY